MALNIGFDTLCDSLCRELVGHICIPQLEEEVRINSNTVLIQTTDQPGERFFPLGTAEEVLRPDRLEQLFNYVVNNAQAPLITVNSATLVENIVRRKLLTFLATLIYTRCRMSALKSFVNELLVVRQWGPEDEAWSRLPVPDDERLRRTLGDDVTAHTFVSNQELFCAAVLEKNQEVQHDFRRKPYVRERLIGQGSFGKIYKVVIAPHHFKDKQQLSNTEEMTLARKDFELSAHGNAHEQERDVLREIMRNAITHRNIMRNFGSLQIGSTYSLFMPLADCDLHQYMMERNTAPPNGWAQKGKLLDCAVGLAGAIDYLHTQLESDRYEKLSCFHMDLKPQNILVTTDPNTSEVLWKLSDFNMSRVKTKRRPTDEFAPLQPTRTFGGDIDFNKLFRKRPDFAGPSVTEPTENRRGTGTYLAPEAEIPGESVSSGSDTWSLGCVVSVVFTYLQGGANAVQEFTALRALQGVDRFFAFSTTTEPRRLQDAVLSNEVRKWFNELRQMAMKENAMEGLIFEEMMKFLLEQVLVVDPQRRRATKAKDVRQKLIDASNAYERLSSGIFPPEHISLIDRVTRHFQIRRRRQDYEVPAQDWVIPLPETRACEFGPQGRVLACVTPTHLALFSLDHVCLTNDFKDLIKRDKIPLPVQGRTWLSSIGVSQDYVVVATDHHQFDCYVYHIYRPDSHTGRLDEYAHVELKLPPICKIAISPNGELVAFVLKHPDPDAQGGGNGSLYVVRRTSLSSTHSTRSSSTVSLQSQSTTTLDPVLGRPIPLPAAAEDIRELRFSASNALYAVIKPKHPGMWGENALTILAWSIRGGTRQALEPSRIVHDGKDDILQGLFTSFAPYNNSLACLVVSQEKRIITKSWNPKSFTQTEARGYRIAKVLIDDDDQSIISFGIREANNRLRLLTFPCSTGRRDSDNVRITEVATLPNMTLQSRFTASVYSPSENARLRPYLWIADLNAHSIRIIPVSRDNAAPR